MTKCRFETHVLNSVCFVDMQGARPGGFQRSIDGGEIAIGKRVLLRIYHVVTFIFVLISSPSTDHFTLSV